MRNKWAALGGWFLAVLLCATLAGPGYTAEPQGTQVAPPPPAPDSDIIFTGKLSCSLKRRIDLPFKGVITSLRAVSGQRVATGDVLATYRLAPEAMLAIRQRLSPPQIAETEVRLAEVERNLVPLLNKERELSQLVPKKLAPAQSLSEAKRQIALVQEEKKALQGRLQTDRQLAQQDQEVLGNLLGGAIKSGKVPRDVALKAPISGYIIWVNPEVRNGAELPPTPGAFQVGVMDPMLLRAQAFEIEALQIKIGDQAEVTLDSLPGQKFQGRVSRVSWSAISTGLDQPSYYDVEIQVPNPDLSLKEGLKARIVLHKSK
ncbi:MAG: efflux RND transporter periplasmic adaptor subunit [Desulfobaccales bacterium]